MTWKPISTAPKDGTRVELRVEGTGGGIIAAKWMGSWWGFDRLTLGVPTAWRPIISTNKPMPDAPEVG